MIICKGYNAQAANNLISGGGMFAGAVSPGQSVNGPGGPRATRASRGNAR